MNRPIKTVSSEAPIFDGNEAVCWLVSMTGNVENPRFKNIAPGVLYTFVFRQDASGGNRFVWPTSCINPPTVNIAPNITTTVNFIGMGGGQMASNVTGSVTK